MQSIFLVVGQNKERRNKMLNKISIIYADWCNDNKLSFVSADEQDTTKLTNEQNEWLREFIDIWNNQEDVDQFIYQQRKEKRDE